MRDDAARTDVSIPSGSVTLAAWLYRPAQASPPVVVMAHGLGGVKEMRLDAYAERFVAAGYAVVVFDYRHFGASGGHPRQLLDITTQLEDWHNALSWVRAQADLDSGRIVIWGTSFGGGHVIQVAAEDQDIAAVIAQCPFTDGPASARAGSRVSAAKATALAVLDRAGSLVGRRPVMVASSGPPGSAALMSGPDAHSGYLALTENAPTFRNHVAARFGLAIARHRPGLLTDRVAVPVFFAVCDTDTAAPAAATRRHVARAPRGEVRLYPFGHFDIYLGEPFEQAVADYLDFLSRHVPISATASASGTEGSNR